MCAYTHAGEFIVFSQCRGSRGDASAARAVRVRRSTSVRICKVYTRKKKEEAPRLGFVYKWVDERGREGFAAEFVKWIG